MLQTEGPFSMEGRHSSTDSNRASSGDVSPYDNNSPVLSERPPLIVEDTILNSQRLFKVPEQCMLASNLQPKSRENSPASWLEKDNSEDYFNIWGTWHSTLRSGSKDQGITAGSYGDIHTSSSLKPGQCSLSQGNLSLPSPHWPESTTEFGNVKQIIRRSHTTSAFPGCHPHAPLSRVFSTPQIEGDRSSSQSDTERHFSTSSTEHFVDREADAACLYSTAQPWYHRQAEIIRKDRPPPPYPDRAKQSSTSPVWPAASSEENPLWRLQRPEINPGTAAERGKAVSPVPDQSALCEKHQVHTGTKSPKPNSERNSKNLTELDWHDWQRDRWQIWEILSPDNPDALPETLV